MGDMQLELDIALRLVGDVDDHVIGKPDCRVRQIFAEQLGELALFLRVLKRAETLYHVIACVEDGLIEAQLLFQHTAQQQV